jgi:hypothetical protein
MMAMARTARETMAKYFHINHGLRGAYMPDGEPYIVMVKTRRELKDAIVAEAEGLGEMVGLGKRKIASFAAECWREAKKKNPAYLPYCLPCHDRSISIATYSYGIFCSVASRSDYLEQFPEDEMEN